MATPISILDESELHTGVPPLDVLQNNMPNIAAKIIWWVLALTSFTEAKPIFTDDKVRKIQESCVVAMDGSSAHVSCSVTYRKLRLIEGKLYMVVPVFIPASADPNAKDVHSSIEMRLEIEGSDATFRSAGLPNDELPPIDDEKPKIPAEHQKIYFYFECDPPELDEFTVVATYKQPLIKGAAYYLPLFEYAEVAGAQKNFVVTFLPLNNSELILESVHEDRQKVMSTRITVSPVHDEIIVVRTKKTGEPQR